MSNEPKPWTPPDLTPADPFANDAQIQAVVKVYADEMRTRGHIVGLANAGHLEQAARINDVWRVAFARVLGAPQPAALPPDLGAMLASIMKPAPAVGLSGPALVELLDAARAVCGEWPTVPTNYNAMGDAISRLRGLLP